MENQNEPPKKRDKKIWIFAVLLFILFIMVGLYQKDTTPNTPTAKSEPKENKEDQRETIQSIFDTSKGILERSSTMIYTITSAKSIPRTPELYNLLKEDEDYFKRISAKLIEAKASAKGSFGEDMDKALDELSTASDIHWNIDSDLANYINIGDLEYQRKATEEINKNPTALILTAISRINLVAEKAGMDSEAMKQEIINLQQKIKQGLEK